MHGPYLVKFSLLKLGLDTLANSAILLPMKKIIQYRVREIYGQPLEYIVSEGDAKIVQQLTGKKTITGIIRELIRDLSGDAIQFERVF